ncbi:hypothetical protein T484DRAFT_1834436 [Baffinella frigidus]|nr:hypothetical protein T484DRAFT_1834436 [Cryptophyta sp. CCMP2293]
MADPQSLCKVPRWLVVGDLNESLLCGLCDCFLREPRKAPLCDHTFCRECYEEALSTEACCPTCKVPNHGHLQRCGPFEAMVNNTVVKCINSILIPLPHVHVNISPKPAESREASPARSASSNQSPGVDEEEYNSGGSVLPSRPTARGGGRSESGSVPPPAHSRSESFASPFDLVKVTVQDLVALCSMLGLLSARHKHTKEELVQMVAPLQRPPKVKP